ncbi:MAG: hypothetical protein STSR0003_26090 [Smithella sp.]
MVMLGVVSLFIPAMFPEESRFSRLPNISLTDTTTYDRLAEISDFFKQSINDNSIIYGKGLGGVIQSTIYEGNDTGTMHVGIFNIWMKMGLIVFLLFVILSFIVIPYLYINTLINSAKIDPPVRTANLVVIPMVFPFLLSLVMSGGFAEVNFLFVGFAYLMYGAIKRNGLGHLASKSVDIL